MTVRIRPPRLEWRATRPAAWALPATVTSVASATAFVISFLLLRHCDVSRLPIAHPTWGVSLAFTASALAWFVTLKCGSRPGPLAARVWALWLALAASVVAVVALSAPVEFATRSGTEVAASSLAAALVLSARLIRVWPGRPVTLLAGPLALILVLSAELMAMAVGARYAASRDAARDDAVNALRELRDRVNAVAAYDWSKTTVDSREARTLVSSIDLSRWVPGLEAAVLCAAAGDVTSGAAPLLAELSFAIERALAVGAGPSLTPERIAVAPFKTRPFRFADPAFSSWSAVAVAYYQNMVRLADHVAAAGLCVTGGPERAAVTATRETVDAAILARRARWEDRWIVSTTIPGAEERPRWRDLLEAPLAPDSGVAVAGVFDLMDGLGAPQLYHLRRPCSDGSPGGDCVRWYSYALDQKGEGLYVQLEVQLVYSRDRGESSTPDSLRLLFPRTTPGADFDEQVREAHDALLEVMRSRYGDELWVGERSVREPVRLEFRDRAIVVEAPTLVPYAADQRAAVINLRRIDDRRE